MTVEELLERISSRELSEWLVYMQAEPFGEQKADWRMGVLAALWANTYRDRRQHPAPFEPADFMPDYEAGQKRQTVDDMLAFVEMLNTAFGGVDLRHGHTG